MTVRVVARKNQVGTWMVGLVEHKGQAFLVEIGNGYTSKKRALDSGKSVCWNRTPESVAQVIAKHGLDLF